MNFLLPLVPEEGSPVHALPMASTLPGSVPMASNESRGADREEEAMEEGSSQLPSTEDLFGEDSS